MTPIPHSLPTPVTVGLLDWLDGFAEILGAERVTLDQLSPDDLCLMALPEDIVTSYMDGSRDVTANALFRVRLASLTDAERQDAHARLDALTRRIWERVLGGDLPSLGEHRQAQSVRVSQPPYLLQPDGSQSIYQLGLEINYIERRPTPSIRR